MLYSNAATMVACVSSPEAILRVWITRVPVLPATKCPQILPTSTDVLSVPRTNLPRVQSPLAPPPAQVRPAVMY